jgi:hypothetical protein
MIEAPLKNIVPGSVDPSTPEARHISARGYNRQARSRITII